METPMAHLQQRFSGTARCWAAFPLTRLRNLFRQPPLDTVRLPIASTRSVMPRDTFRGGITDLDARDQGAPIWFTNPPCRSGTP
ncbi:hypothetical protein BHAOGJBA_1190 [Methylobacterium hispanicum]|uniref:Uncharacterized protein n=1 Tax=Methylobacterium hispanicum TaxID=270350 RepID=A0AAV4ZI42_9HYPH|nr:hypothetical protein BHAOGJBA_1190 [Methylobacterium hispanicum]